MPYQARPRLGREPALRAFEWPTGRRSKSRTGSPRYRLAPGGHLRHGRAKRRRGSDGRRRRGADGGRRRGADEGQPRDVDGRRRHGSDGGEPRGAKGRRRPLYGRATAVRCRPAPTTQADARRRWTGGSGGLGDGGESDRRKLGIGPGWPGEAPRQGSGEVSRSDYPRTKSIQGGQGRSRCQQQNWADALVGNRVRRVPASGVPLTHVTSFGDTCHLCQTYTSYVAS